MSGDTFELKSEPALDFRQATTADLSTVMEILTEAAAWLQAKGIDQWPSPPNEHWQRRMRATVERGEVYTVGVAQNRFGIVRFTWSDPYWPDGRRAGYVHSMAIRSDMHSQNLGAAILFWAALPAFQAAQNIWMLGMRASYINEWGLAFISDRFMDSVLAAIRQNLAKAGALSANQKSVLG